MTKAPPPRASRVALWAAALFVFALVTGVMLAFRAQLDKAHFVLVYLLVVLGGSAVGGRAIGLSLAGLSFLAFDYFFLPPYATLIIANPLDWLALVTFLATGIVAAQLLTRAQDRAEDARRRADEVQRLAALGAETLNAVRAEDALRAIAEVIRTSLDEARCDIYAYDAPGEALRLVASAGAPDAPPGRAAVDANSLAAWVAGHGSAVREMADGTARIVAIEGFGGTDAQDAFESEPADDARVLVVPLRVRERRVGVLRIEHRATQARTGVEREFLSALAYYAALGVERLRLSTEAAHVESLREADRLKSALLATVSHDLRTPLTTIKALAHDIGVEGARAGDDRAGSIEEEADRLTRVVGDLLEMSRLTGGAITFHPEFVAAEELIGAALQRVHGVQGGREILVVRAADEPLLVGRFDFVHALRAFGNVIENALKYSHEGAVELAVRRDGEALVFSVMDRGPGVPAPERERIFEPFYRPPGVLPDIGGTGLGLTIARGLAVAQGGDVRYAPRAGGGSVFEVRLPASDAEYPPKG